MEQVDCVVPVPLHWRREYPRGFNQAREIARHLGPPVTDVLVRRRATRAQVELAADRRRANVAGAFALRRGWCFDHSIRGKKLLLVDDVSTTGATLEACARVLKEAGASEVYALTAARVVTMRRTIRPSPITNPNPGLARSGASRQPLSHGREHLLRNVVRCRLTVDAYPARIGCLPLVAGSHTFEHCEI